MNLEHQEQREKYITMERDPIHILYCTKDHILGAELCQLMNIHMATISNLKLTSVLKLGNCPILSKIDNSLPTKMRLNLFRSELTSLEDKIPLSYFKSMYSLSNEDIMNHIAKEIEVIADRNFIEQLDTMKANPYSRNRSQKLNAGMNVVPYIDVMLVLLVIFMVTAPMLTTGVDIDLPKAQTKSLQQGTQLPVIVSLKSDGQLYLSTQDKTDEPMSEAALIATLNNLQSQPQYQFDGKPNVNVMINADQNNQYGDIIQLMANLQQAGIQKVGLLTAPPKPASK